MRASPGVRDHPPNLPRDPHSSAASGCHSRRRELERLDLHEFEVAQLGNLLPEEVAEARALIPRDVVSGWDSTLTLLGEHQRRGDGGTGGGTGDAHSFWCFFGDGVAVPARSVSSALAICEILPPAAAADDERRSSSSSSSSLASSSSSRSASDDTNASSDESDEYPTSVRRAHSRTRRVDLASPAAFDRGRGAPCGGPDSGCRSFRHFPAPLAIHRVRPTSAPVTGGSLVQNSAGRRSNKCRMTTAPGSACDQFQ